jgi:hypothetical protein
MERREKKLRVTPYVWLSLFLEKNKEISRKRREKTALQCLCLTVFCPFSVFPSYYLFTSTNLGTRGART